MALKLLFIHGTGVREPHYTRNLQIVIERVAQFRPDIQVEPCYWGGRFGAKLNAGGLSVPVPDQDRAVDVASAVSDAEALIALWALLYDDPLFEIRLAAAQAGTGGSVFGGDESLLDPLKTPLETGPVATALQARLAALGLIQVYTLAAAELADHPEVRGAVLAAPDPKALAEPLARAVVARMNVLALAKDENDLLSTDAAVRDDLAVRLAAHLAGSDKSIIGSLFSTLTKPLQGLAQRWGTNYVVRRRAAVTDGAAPGAGDILVYQAHGRRIRDFIRQRITEAGGPVVLLAHSLGGIACVDTLIETSLPPVQRLITAGSQAPFFYEIGALQTLAFQDVNAGPQLPTHFPPWLNFYDLRDFLSYVGRPVFGSKVTDVAADNRLPFPQAHSGYWHNDDVWARIGKELSAL